MGLSKSVNAHAGIALTVPENKAELYGWPWADFEPSVQAASMSVMLASILPCSIGPDFPTKTQRRGTCSANPEVSKTCNSSRQEVE